MARMLFAPVDNRTLKLTFVSYDDPTYDPVTDLRPAPEYLQNIAESSFGPVYCVAVEYLDGSLQIEREE